MSRIISVIGGTGYVGMRCIRTLLNNQKDIKIYAIARDVRLDSTSKFDDRVEFVRANALDPDSYSPYIEKSTGIIHTVGKLISTDDDSSKDSYKSVNHDTALKVAQIANDLAVISKKNFVFISAERGLMFPLSLFFSGYLDYKRRAEEKLLKDFPNLNPIVLRPGLINDMKDRPYIQPLAWAFNTHNYIEKNLLDKVFPNIGETLNLPAASIELDTLALYAAAGSLGKIEPGIYSNDHMNDNNNMTNIRFDV
jgi:nucleoside-diphosphate-sugar epimerase